MAQWKNTFARLALGPLAAALPEVRERMLATILQTRTSLALTSFTLLLICATAAGVSRSGWAWVWLGGSLCLVAGRVIYPFLSPRVEMPVLLIRIMVGSVLLFAGFGWGAAACVASGDMALTTMAVSGVFGIVAGLASRWAALPRAAITTMVLAAAPPILVLGLQGGPDLVAAIAMALVVSTIALFTVQNQKNLLAAISAEEANRRQAHTDALTGLANRAEVNRRLEEACRLLGSSSARGGFAVLYLDLDGFKSVNDRHGHAAGDELLRNVAVQLREIVGPGPTLGRIGGDEFLVILNDSGEAAARTMANRIIEQLSHEIRLVDGTTVRVGCSAGVSLAPQQGREPELLMARADAALYAAKNLGKGQSGLWRALEDPDSLPAA